MSSRPAGQQTCQTPTLPDGKLSFRVCGSLGEKPRSSWNVAYRWLTDLTWNVSKWQCLPLCPPWECAEEEVGGPQAAIFASCCSNLEMRSS